MCYLVYMKNNTNKTMTEMNLGILRVNDAELLAKLETIRAEYAAALERLNKETLNAITAHVAGQEVMMRDERNANRVNVIANAVEMIGGMVRVEMTNGNRAKVCVA